MNWHVRDETLRIWVSIAISLLWIPTAAAAAFLMRLLFDAKRFPYDGQEGLDAVLFALVAGVLALLTSYLVFRLCLRALGPGPQSKH